jgi:hypothetical protein
MHDFIYTGNRTNPKDITVIVQILNSVSSQPALAARAVLLHGIKLLLKVIAILFDFRSPDWPISPVSVTKKI